MANDGGQVQVILSSYMFKYNIIELFNHTKLKMWKEFIDYTSNET